MNKARYQITRALNCIGIYSISFILLGSYFYQFTTQHNPCSICLLQCLSMTGVAMGPLLNLRYPIRPLHYGIALFSCLLGGFISLFQIAAYACPGFPPYGKIVFGLELYTWSFFVFCASILGTALLLILYRSQDSQKKASLFFHEKVAIFLFFLVTAAHIVTVFWKQGLALYGSIF